MFRKTTLENGLRILTAPMQGTNTVTALVLCATGSDYERPAEGGISHFLEHMFFKGTENRPGAGFIRNELDGMGSSYNAFTGHETTGYHIKAAKIYADRVLDILADVYKYSLLAEDEIAREKQVVIEEMHLRRDTPTTHIWDLWERFLYGDQPAGRDIAGREETVRQFVQRDLREYFRYQYVAGNTAVIIAGAIDEAWAIRRVGELFGDVRHSPPRDKPTVVEEQGRPALFAEERRTDQTHAIIGFRSYDAFHPKRYTASVLATVLGGSSSSRMFSRIREELGLAYHVSSDADAFSNRGYLATYAGVAHENLVSATEAIVGEYRRIREEPVSSAELQRTKDYVKGQTLMSLEASDAVAGFVGGEEMLTQKPLTADEVFAIIEAITPADLQDAARELLRPERLNLAFLGPHSDAAKLQSIADAFS